MVISTMNIADVDYIDDESNDDSDPNNYDGDDE